VTVPWRDAVIAIQLVSADNACKLLAYLAVMGKQRWNRQCSWSKTA